MLKLPGYSTYFGGKASPGTAQRIINHIQPHDTLVIPFAGNCAVTRCIRWPARVLVNDLDPNICAAWAAADFGPALEVSNLPALDFLAQVLIRPGLGRIVVYCDPPYPLDSRKSQLEIYRYEMQAADHSDFLAAVRFLRVDCLVSTYPNREYAEQLSHWNRTEFQSATRAGMATEWLFFNYSAPAVLHDVRHAGSGFRQRQSFRRKAERWLAKYHDMPSTEQQFILSRLLSEARPALVAQLMASSA